MTLEELSRDIALELIRKSGVREWDDDETAAAISLRAVEMASLILYGEPPEPGMATSKSLYVEMDGTPKQICFADHATDFTAPTAANDLRKTTDGSQETDVQLDLTSVASGSARQSTKFDFGAVRARKYAIRGALEMAATPTAGLTVDLWLAPSQSGTAGTGNPGGASGSDSAYAGYSSNLEASKLQLQYIGQFVLTAQTTGTVQIAEGGTFSPRERYASLVVINRGGSAFHSDAAEINIVFDPIVEQGQAT